MKKVYVDGSWFRPFTEVVRKQMMEDVKNFIEDEVQLFDPSSTEASKKLTNAKDLKERVALAARIYKDNIKQIQDCDFLIYGSHENDLGTASDLGNALRLNKPIWRYDYLSRDFDLIDNKKIISKIIDCDPEKIFIFTKETGMDMGVFFGFHSDKKLKYMINKGLSDNIMLRMNHQKYILDPKDNYKLKTEEMLIDEISIADINLEKLNSDPNCLFGISIEDLGLFNSTNFIQTSVS